MLYDYIQLKNLNDEDIDIPFRRYMHKFSNHRKEIKKLKTHEKEFLFNIMSLLRNEKGELAFDLSSIDEASEFYFNKIILFYYEYLDFNKQTRDHLNLVIDSVCMEDDKKYFDNYYIQWLSQLNAKKGKYLNVIHKELNIRLKGLQSNYKRGKLEEAEFNYLTKEHYTTAFFIYYKVKLFFEGFKYKFIIVNILDNEIVINIYSFVHILFRHYFPSLDNGNNDRSINDELPFLNIEYLPYSLREFLIAYFKYDIIPIDSSREYLLFSFKVDKYIIWLEYKSLEELNNNKGFEFRTLYKCEEKRDLSKFDGIREYPVNLDLSFYF